MNIISLSSPSNNTETVFSPNSSSESRKKILGNVGVRVRVLGRYATVFHAEIFVLWLGVDTTPELITVMSTYLITKKEIKIFLLLRF